MIPYIENEFMKSVEIDIRECEIEILDMVSSYVKETQLLSLYKESDSDDKGNNKFIELIRKIKNTVLRAIASVLDKVAELISGDKGENHVNIHDYLSTTEGQIELSYDIDKIHAQVLREMAEGKKIIQAISRGTKIDPGRINEYYNNSVKFLSENTASIKSVVNAGAVASSYSKYTKMYDDFRNSKGMDGIFSKIKDVDDQKLAIKAYKGMCNYETKSLKIFSNFMSDFNKYKKKAEKGK